MATFKIEKPTETLTWKQAREFPNGSLLENDNVFLALKTAYHLVFFNKDGTTGTQNVFDSVGTYKLSPPGTSLLLKQ